MRPFPLSIVSHLSDAVQRKYVVCGSIYQLINYWAMHQSDRCVSYILTILFLNNVSQMTIHSQTGIHAQITTYRRRNLRNQSFDQNPRIDINNNPYLSLFVLTYQNGRRQWTSILELSRASVLAELCSHHQSYHFLLHLWNLNSMQIVT